MINNIGYACINTSIKSNFKDCRIGSIYKNGIVYLKDIIINNLSVTKEILFWNINNDIHMYRASSKLIPFATHKDILNDFEFRWYKDRDICTLLNDIKEIVNQSNIRLSMHPDQFTVLNSLNENVVLNSINNLKYHKELLEAMGGKDIVIHTGGLYGDRTSATKRFIENFNKLDNSISKYLRLENDDVCYNIHDVLDIHTKCNVPIVLDIHHHNCNNNCLDIKDILPSISKSWQHTGLIPKCHISTGTNNYNDRKHADYVTACDFFSFLDITSNITIDLMVEAKAKEMAVLNLKKLFTLK